MEKCKNNLDFLLQRRKLLEQWRFSTFGEEDSEG